jgi:hypothetical protein
MKKLFTLLALLTCFLGANAKTVVDAEVDFSKYTDISQWGFPNSWGGSDQAKSRLSIQNGCLHFESTEVTVNDDGVETGWLCQFFPIGGVNAEIGTVYTLHYKIKGDHAENVSMLGFGQTPYGQFPITTDWVEGTVDYEATSSDGNILMQCGSYIGSWDIAYLKITHEERDDQRPKEWIDLLENGDAEKPWGDLASIRFNDQENNYKICAWGKEKGVNMNENDGWDPFPARIEDDGTGNHVFVVHGKIADTPKDGDQDPSSWDNQFWIQAPRQLKAGELLKVHFRYKASEAANTNTQMHHQNPSDYMHWQCIGDIAFTTEWQEFDKEISWPQGGDDLGWSICFNLNAQNKNAVDFYFDDLQISELKLDHGWFIASSNADNGIAYNYDNAIEFEVLDDSNADDVLYTATVGTAGKPETWIKEVMISTVRGHDGTFKSSTISPTSSNIKPYNLETGEGDWYDYTSKSSAKIALPAAGVWQIILATGTKQMAFVQIEGDEVVVKEPVDIVTNATENVVNATERQDLKDDLNNGVITVKEEADDPAGVTVGGEGHEGQPWDNQFWIAANRDLKADEVTVLKFKYKASKAARTSTQAHKVGDDGKPCTYLNWQAIGDVNFTEEWQNFETTFTVPAGDDGMRSIVFNMAEIKEACDYYIKDVQWYVKDEALEAQGKTMENLINAEGDANFWIKVNSGAPEQASGISTVVSDKKVSNVTYNLAGQRVSKNYKGIVIKNGVKYIAK